MADESTVDVRTARLAVLGTQMSVLLHELRQPLFAMKAFLEIEAQRGNHDRDRVRDLVPVDSSWSEVVDLDEEQVHERTGTIEEVDTCTSFAAKHLLDIYNDQDHN